MPRSKAEVLAEAHTRIPGPQRPMEQASLAFLVDPVTFEVVKVVKDRYFDASNFELVKKDLGGVWKHGQTISYKFQWRFAPQEPFSEYQTDADLCQYRDFPFLVAYSRQENQLFPSLGA